MRRIKASRKLWLFGFVALIVLTAWGSQRQVQVTSQDTPTWATGRRALQQRTQQETPLVALMFLTRGPMPLEPVWREFMEASAMLEPINPAQIQARKPHVSKSRSSRSLQAAAANQAAAWSQHSQHRMSVLNQALADLDKQPGPAIMTGAGFPQHSPSQPEMTDAAPVDTALPPFIHDSQLLYGGHEGSEPSRAAEALSGSQLQNVTVGLLSNPAVHSTAIHSSNTGNEDSKAHQVRDLGSATSRAWTEKDSQTPGDIWSQPLAGPHVTGAADAAHLTRATRTLSQQSATNSATDQPHVEHDHAGHSDAVGLPLAAAGRNGRPLLNSSKRRADSAWSLRGLWARFWGTQQHAQERFPSQQGSSADWSWTARAHGDIIDMQHMFSVYVHCPPDFSYAPGNLFAGYEVPGRVPVTWGQWSVVEGERILLRTALRTLANQRFVLLSETCLPLGPPHVLYLQYLSEPLARINACKQDTVEDAYRRGLDRWQPAMRTTQLDRKHWRKSAQWFSLSRRHAAAVAADFHAAPLFEEHCYSYLPGRDLPIPAKVQALLDQNITVDRRTCVADEHYVPTLLAMHGLDDETDCLGMMTHTSWVWPAWSPNTYANWQISPAFLQPLRKAWFSEEQCDWALAAHVASTHFRLRGSGTPLATLPHWQHSNSTQRPGQVQPYEPMHPGCSLVARKFDLSALDAVMRLGADCEAGFAWSSFCYQP